MNMSLSTTFSTARAGLALSSSMSSVTSRNIGGANDGDYSQKRVVVTTGSSGLRSISIERSADQAVRRSLLDTTSRASAADEVAGAYGRLSSLLNVGSGTLSLVGRIGDLESAIQAATVDPGNISGLQGIVDSAGRLVGALKGANEGLRQIQADADQQIETSVNRINDLLSDFAEIETQMLRDGGTGADLSDLQDRRDVVLGALSVEVGITTVKGPDGSSSIYASGGAVLFSGSPRPVQFSRTFNLEAGAPASAVVIDGVKVTGRDASMQIVSGKLAGSVQVRDVVVPQSLAQLDEFSRSLVYSFSEGGAGDEPDPPRLAGLFSFSDSFAMSGLDRVADGSKLISVNRNVDPAHGGILTRLRDGGISAPDDARYIKNITGVQDFSAGLIGSLASLSAAQLIDASLGFGDQSSVGQLAETILSNVGSGLVKSNDAADQAHVTADGYATFLSNATGVNLDDELSKLLQIENSYRATTKIISTVDNLYQSLFEAVR